MSSKSAAPPQHSNTSASADSLVGTAVQYDDEGQVLLGLITGTKKDKLTVLTVRGRELDLIRGALGVYSRRIPSVLCVGTQYDVPWSRRPGESRGFAVSARS